MENTTRQAIIQVTEILTKSGGNRTALHNELSNTITDKIGLMGKYIADDNKNKAVEILQTINTLTNILTNCGILDKSDDNKIYTILVKLY